MLTNKVFIIGDRQNGRIYNTEGDYFSPEISFSSLFPSRDCAEFYLYNELADVDEEYYAIVQANVVRFDRGVLEVSHEQFYFRG